MNHSVVDMLGSILAERIVEQRESTPNFCEITKYRGQWIYITKYTEQYSVCRATSLELDLSVNLYSLV